MISEGLTHLATPLDELIPLEGNPRKGDITKIAASLRRFGQRKPIVARKLDGTGAQGEIIAGNHTYLAAKSLGWEEIAVLFVDDDKWTARAFAIADNRTAEVGTFDEELLADMLTDLASDDDLFMDTGWSTDELATLIKRLGEIPEGPDFDPPTPNDNPPDQQFAWTVTCICGWKHPETQATAKAETESAARKHRNTCPQTGNFP